MSAEESNVRLRKSLACIRQWSENALEHLPPYGNCLARCLGDIMKEADAALKAEGGAS